MTLTNADFNILPKSTPWGELPPKVVEWLDGRYVNHNEQEDAAEPSISVVDYGAVAGSPNSQSAAIQAAVNAAGTFGVPVTVPAGTYTMGDMVSLPSGTSLRMSEGTVLDFSASGSSYYLGIQGAAGAEVSLGAGVTRGAWSIPWSGDALQPGDWLIVRSADIFDPDSTGTGHGELIQVRAVEAGVVHFLTPFCDDYSTDVRLTPVALAKNVEVRGGTIRGNYTPGSGKTGIRVQYTDGLRLTGVRVEGIAACHVSVRDSVDAWAQWCEFEWAESNYMGYAMSFADTTRDSGCLWGTFRGVRHTLSTNNTTTAHQGGVVRRILFFGNTIEYTSRAMSGSQTGGDAVDTHSAAEDIWIARNTIRGSQGQAINVECPTARIEDNDIYGGMSLGISYHNESGRPGDVSITGNRVYDCQGHGVYARSGNRGSGIPPMETLLVADNRVRDVTGDGILVGYIRQDRGAVVTGNRVARAQGVPLRVRKQTGLVSHGNSVSGGTSIGIEYADVVGGVLGPDSIDEGDSVGPWSGIKATNVVRALITPGAISGTGPDAVGVEIGSSCANLSLGPTAHLDAPTPLVNNGPSSVRSY